MTNTDHLFFGLDYDPNSDESINFTETRFMDLSPFSAHQIKIWGEMFPTVEHAYQASRIKPGEEREQIKNATCPMDAWRVGQKYKNDPNLAVEGLDKYAVMEELCRAKLAQHKDVKAVLKATGDRVLLKVYDTDYYWGTGADNTGGNELGKIWMKLREEIIVSK